MSAWRSALRIRLQWAIVRLQRYRWVERLLRFVCQAGTWNVTRLLKKQPGVESVFARHTHPWSSAFVVGHSDLDLTVVLSDEAGADLESSENVARLLERRRLIHYYVSPDDARLTTAAELQKWTQDWPPAEILVTAADWTLLGGHDVLRHPSYDVPPRVWSDHPEFNRWWSHILQDYLLLPLPGLEHRYHRVFYRGARKQLAYFTAARGTEFTQAARDNLGQSGSGLEALLATLEARGFWQEGGTEDPRPRIFHHVLAQTSAFFARENVQERPMASTAFDSPARFETDTSEAAATALASRLEAVSNLTTKLAGVLTYPTPYCHPFHQADLLLPAGQSFEGLSALIEILRAEFGGREFEVDGHHFSLAMVPESVHCGPSALRGTPFPFLPEHVARHGRTLLRPEAIAIEPGASKAELRDWCRTFLPYFAANLARRVEHSSRTLNFSQLAAVRVFAATGEIATRPPEIMERHHEAFGAESPSTELWDYLLRDKPGRKDRALFRAAAVTLAREIERTEGLLATPRSQVSAATAAPPAL